MEGMLSVKDYADARDLHPDTVRKWCVSGNLPGAVKEKDLRNGAGFQYWIPADAEPVKPRRKYTRRGEWEVPDPEPEEPKQKEKPKKKLRTMREKAEHIRKYCIFRSFRQLREETGLTTAEIRRIYDRLHEVHGI